MVLKASYSCGAVKYLHFNTRKFHNFSPNSWKVINLQTQFETALELFAAYCKLILITTNRHLNFTGIQHHLLHLKVSFPFPTLLQFHLPSIKKKKKIATNSKANSRAFNASSKLPPPPPPLKLRMVCMSNSIWPIYLLAHYFPPPPFTKEGEKKEGNVTVTSV